MPKFIGTITRDDASDFKLVKGEDVNIRNSKDLTGITLSDNDTILLDDSSKFNGKLNGTEDSTGKIALSQLNTYIGVSYLPLAGGTMTGDISHAGDFTLDVGGDIELNADDGVISFKDNTTPIADFTSPGDTKLYYDANNFFRCTVASTGATELITVGAGDLDSNFVLDIDGAIELDAGNGRFIAKNAGTQFSAANSAYAGMVLGYTKIQNLTTTAGYNQIAIGTGFAQLTTAQGTHVSITFVAPPSGNVEIVFSACLVPSAIDREIFVMLASDTSATEVNQIYTYDNNCWKSDDELDKDILDVRFAVTGLTANASTTYYIAAKSSVASTYIYHGTNRTGLHSPPITVKAVALPNTITTGE